jgi:hypothetical protein
VNEVREVNPEGGTCAMTVDPGGHYCDEEGLRVSSFIELMAQSFGYVRAAQLRFGLITGQTPPTRAYLVAVQDAVFREISARPGDTLEIRVSDFREFGAITAFKASVSCDSGANLATASLKIFSN